MDESPGQVVAAERASFAERLRRARETAGLTQEELAERAALTPNTIGALERGEHRHPYPATVRALASALTLSPRERADLLASVPLRRRPARDVRSPRSSFPASHSSLVGREHDVAAICALLRQDDVRLVTLSGPGGVGKTRLALAVASELGGEFTDGAAWVDLAPLREPELLAAAVARALGVSEGDRPLTELLATAVARRRLLLVLDNCEHLLPAISLVGTLLAAGPQLRVLATSRARLRLRGEHEFVVPPLQVGTEDREQETEVPDVPPSAVHRPPSSPAVRLFVERAQAVQRDFILTADEAFQVAEICRRLEGLPLAIELAAAHVKFLPPTALLTRLEHRLPLLARGARDAPARQHTMRDAISWSYGLLDPEEQALFRALAVFAGGFTEEAADRVAGDGVIGPWGDREDEPPITHHPSPHTLAIIASLVDQSLVQHAVGAGTEPRFRMLETIREYGLEQLEGHGERETARQRHAIYFLSVAEDAEQRLRGPEQVAQLTRLEAEHDNLRAALAWSQATAARGDVALRLAGALHRFWFLRGYFSEGRRWLEGALMAAGAAEPSPERAKALAGAALLAMNQDDYAIAQVHLQQGIALARALGDTASVAYALQVLAWGDILHADHAALRAAVEESIVLYRALGDRWGLATSLCTLAMVLIDGLQFAEASAPIAESLALARELGDTSGLARALHYSGELARFRGDDALARDLYEECSALYETLNQRGAAAIVRHNLGYVAQHQGDLQRGLACFVNALAEHVKGGDRQNVAHCLGGIAGMVGALGRPEQAARLFGAADRLFARLGTSIWPVDKVDYERNLAATRACMSEDAFANAFAAGRELTLEQAVAEAMDWADGAA